MKLSEQPTECAFDARPILAGKDARTLARDLLTLSQEEFSAASKNWSMTRAKLRGLQRNAVVALNYVGTEHDAPLLETMRRMRANAPAPTSNARVPSIYRNVTGPLNVA